MSFINLGLPPGMMNNGTEYQSKGRWLTGTFVRWYQGSMRAIGGWAARTTSALTGKPRALITWRDNVGLRYIGVGTEQKLYALTASLTAGVDITPVGFTTGRADAVSGGGYGVGLYGMGTYGAPRVDNVSVQDASVWTLDTWGERLVGCMSDDGKLYEWALDITTPTVAALISGAPTSCQALVTTPEYFLFALGASGNPRQIKWCDQTNNTQWTASSTNQAGSYIIQSAGRLMCGRKVRGGTLLLTDTDVHFANYIGLPFVYGIQRIGDNCGIISRGAIAVADGRAMWMSQSGFYIYNGSVEQVACDVYDEVFANLNFTQRSKITAVLNSAFSEVWFYYPSAGSTENDSYVVYNYKENHWTMGMLARLCGADKGVFNNPIKADASGYLYDHESGYTYDGTTPYAISAPLEIGDGERLVKCREIIPDEVTLGNVQLSIIAADSPTGATTTYGPFTPAAFTQARWAARQAKLKVEFVSPSADDRWGNPRADVSLGGRR